MLFDHIKPGMRSQSYCSENRQRTGKDVKYRLLELLGKQFHGAYFVDNNQLFTLQCRVDSSHAECIQTSNINAVTPYSERAYQVSVRHQAGLSIQSNQTKTHTRTLNAYLLRIKASA